jgi:ferredoxin
MAYVITDTCVKDLLCIDSCPSDSIHPHQDEPAFEAATQLYINPEECMDCGACVATCPTNSIFPVEELPEDKADFVEKNANFYAS